MSIRTFAAAAAVLVLATGCGDAPSPAQQVPSLTDRLSAVDDAVAAHDDAATVAALDELERTARAARRTGDLDAAQVQGILDTAESVRSALSTDTTTAEPSQTPSETPSTQPSTAPPPPPPPPGKEKKHEPGKPKDKPGHGHED